MINIQTIRKWFLSSQGLWLSKHLWQPRREIFQHIIHRADGVKVIGLWVTGTLGITYRLKAHFNQIVGDHIPAKENSPHIWSNVIRGIYRKIIIWSTKRQRKTVYLTYEYVLYFQNWSLKLRKSSLISILYGVFWYFGSFILSGFFHSFSG